MRTLSRILTVAVIAISFRGTANATCFVSGHWMNGQGVVSNGGVVNCPGAVPNNATGHALVSGGPLLLFPLPDGGDLWIGSSHMTEPVVPVPPPQHSGPWVFNNQGQTSPPPPIPQPAPPLVFPQDSSGVIGLTQPPDQGSLHGFSLSEGNFGGDACGSAPSSCNSGRLFFPDTRIAGDMNLDPIFIDEGVNSMAPVPGFFDAPPSAEGFGPGPAPGGIFSGGPFLFDGSAPLNVGDLFEPATGDVVPLAGDSSGPTVTTSNGITTSNFPDGTVTVDYPDGSHSVTDPVTGTTVTTMGDKIITNDPSTGTTTVANADGSGWHATYGPDNTQTWDHSDGSHYTVDSNGVKTGYENNADGSKTVYPGDGTSHVEQPPSAPQPQQQQAQQTPPASQPAGQPNPPEPPRDGGAVQSLHVETDPNTGEKVAVRVLTFPDGTTVSHYVDDPNGKVVTQSNGTTITQTNDGSTRVNPNGSTETVNYNDNTKTVVQQNGTTTTYPGNGGPPAVTQGNPPPPPSTPVTGQSIVPGGDDTVVGKWTGDTAKAAAGEILDRGKVGAVTGLIPGSQRVAPGFIESIPTAGTGKLIDGIDSVNHIATLGDNMNDALKVAKVEKGKIGDKIDLWSDPKSKISGTATSGTLTQESIHNTLTPMRETIQNYVVPLSK